MSKKAWVVIGSIVVVLGLLAAAAWYFIKNITYECSVKGFKLDKVNLQGAEVTLNIKVDLTNGNPFTINIKNLYYEVYYKGNLLAKSAATKTNQEPIKITKNATETANQDVQVLVNKSNLGAAGNILLGKPTDFTAKVKARIFGFNINLKDLKFTY